MLVVDDDDYTRFLLVRTLSDLGFEDARDASTVSAALSFVRESSPDAVILDLALGPGPNGIDCAHAMRRLSPSIGIVVLSSYQDPGTLVANRPLPAGGLYLSKRMLGDADVLAATIREVLEAPAGRRSVAVTRAPVQLTDDQIEFMRLVAEGHSNAEIARRTRVAEQALPDAVNRVVEQLGIKSDSDAHVRVRITQAYYAIITTQAGR